MRALAGTKTTKVAERAVLYDSAPKRDALSKKGGPLSSRHLRCHGWDRKGSIDDCQICDEWPCTTKNNMGVSVGKVRKDLRH